MKKKKENWVVSWSSKWADENLSSPEVKSDTVVEDVVEFFAIEKRKMGDPLFVGALNKIIGTVSGVENVIDIRVFNKTGSGYSSAEVSQTYVDNTTKQIRQSDSIVFMKSNQIFQIRYPNKDIKIRVKTLGGNTF